LLIVEAGEGMTSITVDLQDSSACTTVLKRKVRVLVVEDDPGILGVIREWLCDRHNVDVYAFTSAEEAVADELPTGFDICLLDYRLGGVDGLMLGAMIREIDPRANLVLMSGVLSPRIEHLALEHGFRAVVHKPVSIGHLERVMFPAALA
jgi:CheY-like chemotaxis protein